MTNKLHPHPSGKGTPAWAVAQAYLSQGASGHVLRGKPLPDPNAPMDWLLIPEDARDLFVAMVSCKWIGVNEGDGCQSHTWTMFWEDGIPAGTCPDETVQLLVRLGLMRPKDLAGAVILLCTEKGAATLAAANEAGYLHLK